MLEITIPGRGLYKLEHLVLDVNGTLALDGRLLDKVARPLLALRDRFSLHLLTADTHGRQAAIDLTLGLRANRIPPGDESGAKAAYVRALGGQTVIAIGQGANDAGMLKEAALGIAVLSAEGLAVEALLNADLLARDIFEALNLIEYPQRLVASLRR